MKERIVRSPSEESRRKSSKSKARRRSSSSSSRSRSRDREKDKDVHRRRRSSRSPSERRRSISPRHRDRDRHDKDYRHRRDRSRDRDRGHYRRRRSRSRDSDDSDGYGYQPRSRQPRHPPAYPAGPGVGPDPYAALRMLNTSSMLPASNGAPQPGGGDTSHVAVSRAWQEQALKARQLVLQQQALSAQMAASRSTREIHIGNLAPNLTTQDTLKQIFNTALAVRFPSLNSSEFGPAVIKVNVHSSQKFAFMELRTSEFATACLDLNGQILLPGAPGPMTVNRPSTYVDPSRALIAAAAASQTLAQFQSGGPTGGPPLPDMLLPSTAVAQSVASALGTLPGPPLPGPPLPGPSLPGPPLPGPPPPSLSANNVSFICVSGMIADGMSREETDEIIEDLKDECLNHGPVASIRARGKDLVCMFDSASSASSASNAINGRLFDGRTLAARQVSEADFLSN